MKLLLLSFVFLFQLGYSQIDTIIYYKVNNKPAVGKEDAIRYISIKKKKENKFKISTFHEHIRKSVDQDLDAEALRVIRNMPNGHQAN